MYCPNCGTQNDDNHYRCIQCRTVIQAAPQPSSASIESDPGMRLLLPVGRSVPAILAGYAGLFSILILPAPVALLLGIIAIIDIKKHPDKYGMGRAIFAVIMGGLFSIPFVLFLIGIVIDMLQSA